MRGWRRGGIKMRNRLFSRFRECLQNYNLGGSFEIGILKP
jgi:hypothetical protein